MTDTASSDPRPERTRRQPPVILTFAAFGATVLAYVVVIAGLFALMRLVGGAR